jgi:hypothetical protein
MIIEIAIAVGAILPFVLLWIRNREVSGEKSKSTARCPLCGYTTYPHDIYHFCINDIQKQRQARK